MNIKIKEIDIEYPDTVLDDKFFKNYFNEQGKDVTDILKGFGKSERRVITENSDSTLSLGIKAALKVLKKAGLKGKDIDIIVFSSQYPEYTCPSQGLILHNAIDGRTDDEFMTLDLNANSSGMVVAFDTISSYLLSKKSFKRALLVGADYLTIHCKSDDEQSLALFGDAACALILERTDEECGIIDTRSYCNSKNYDSIIYPQCGFSYFWEESIDNYNKKILINSGNADMDFVVETIKKSIEEMLRDSNLGVDDIAAFCFSQGAIKNRYKFIEAIGIEPEKFIHVSDKYGETGVNSPFISLYEGVETGQIKRGDYVILASYSLGYIIETVLIKY